MEVILSRQWGGHAEKVWEPLMYTPDFDKIEKLVMEHMDLIWRKAKGANANDMMYYKCGLCLFFKGHFVSLNTGQLLKKN